MSMWILLIKSFLFPESEQDLVLSLLKIKRFQTINGQYSNMNFKEKEARKLYVTPFPRLYH